MLESQFATGTGFNGWRRIRLLHRPIFYFGVRFLLIERGRVLRRQETIKESPDWDEQRDE